MQPLYRLNTLTSMVQALRTVYADMTLTQALVFSLVATRPGQTQRDIMAATGLPDATVSRICGILGPHGNRGTQPLHLLEFRPVMGDRRAVGLYLTSKGLALASNLSSMLGDRSAIAT